MIGARRVSMIAAAVVCLLTAQWNVSLFASEAADMSGSFAPIATAGEPRPAIDASAEPVSPRVRLAIESLPVASAAVPDRAGAGVTHAIRLAPQGFSTAGQIYQGAPYPYPHHHDASIAAIMIGAAAAITGTAVLVYANRPECDPHPYASGCGYGTKVFGSAVLAGGIVGLFVGALTW